jgi:hypothetical protein
MNRYIDAPSELYHRRLYVMFINPEREREHDRVPYIDRDMSSMDRLGTVIDWEPGTPLTTLSTWAGREQPRPACIRGSPQ